MGVRASRDVVFNEEGALLDKDGKPLPVPGTPFRKKSGRYLSGRQSTLTPFSFASVYANGTAPIDAATIAGTYPNGIPGVLERVTDLNIRYSTTSAIPDSEMKAWKLSVDPNHVVTLGRPRTQLIGKDLEMYRPYRVSFSIRLDQSGSPFGWNSKTTKRPIFCLFALSQQGNFSSGQLSAGASPLYLILRGSTLYWEVHTLGDEMGMGPQDPNTTSATYTKFDIGDTYKVRHPRAKSYGLTGLRYHHIVLEFLLDERSVRDGGRGYFRASFNGRPWLRHTGPTALPKTATGDHIPVHDRFGLYEVSGGNLTGGTLCSAVNSCSVARPLLIQHYYCEGA